MIYIYMFFYFVTACFELENRAATLQLQIEATKSYGHGSKMMLEVFLKFKLMLALNLLNCCFP